MTQLERARATALLFVSQHAFVKAMAARATYEGPTITENEAAALERFCRLFREQLTARGDGGLMPPSPPSPPSPPIGAEVHRA